MESTCRVPGGAGRELLALDHRDIRQTAQGQVVRDAATDDTTTDHDDLILALHAAATFERSIQRGACDKRTSGRHGRGRRPKMLGGSTGSR